MRAIDLAEQARHAVDERLAADEAHALMMLCLPDKMLAGAEADFEPNLCERLTKKARQRGGGRLGEGNAQGGQQLVEQPVFPPAQGPRLPPAVGPQTCRFGHG